MQDAVSTLYFFIEFVKDEVNKLPSDFLDKPTLLDILERGQYHVPLFGNDGSPDSNLVSPRMKMEDEEYPPSLSSGEIGEDHRLGLPCFVPKSPPPSPPPYLLDSPPQSPPLGPLGSSPPYILDNSGILQFPLSVSQSPTSVVVRTGTPFPSGSEYYEYSGYHESQTQAFQRDLSLLGTPIVQETPIHLVDYAMPTEEPSHNKILSGLPLDNIDPPFESQGGEHISSFTDLPRVPPQLRQLRSNRPKRQQKTHNRAPMETGYKVRKPMELKPRELKPKFVTKRKV